MLKRAFDLVASIAGLVILSPIIIVLALIVKFTSAGPIFYRAERIGRYGEPFKLYKFRSMVVNADKTGPAITVANDSRVTPIGKFLRKTKLDELSQLINVVKGEMSVVGPRPESPYYVAMYTDEQRKVLDARPGITSPASLKYNEEESLLTGDDWETHYIEVIMPNKIAIDMEYAQDPNIVRDIQLILQTIGLLVKSRMGGDAEE